jgi:hypothetical protein
MYPTGMTTGTKSGLNADKPAIVTAYGNATMRMPPGRTEKIMELQEARSVYERIGCYYERAPFFIDMPVVIAAGPYALRKCHNDDGNARRYD